MHKGSRFKVKPDTVLDDALEIPKKSWHYLLNKKKIVSIFPMVI